jgi:hypothetical protein
MINKDIFRYSGATEPYPTSNSLKKMEPGIAHGDTKEG